MKNNIARLLVILLSVNSMTLKAGAAPENSSSAKKNNATTKTTATKEAAPIKVGDPLVLSEYTKMPSGIMYKIVKPGAKGKKAMQGETVVVNYSGYLLDGKKVGIKFDSSLDRNMPFSFKLGARQVISGWEISLADMEVGETRIVILPSNHAYGSRSTGKIPADSSLIFEITLIKAS